MGKTPRVSGHLSGPHTRTASAESTCGCKDRLRYSLIISQIQRLGAQTASLSFRCFQSAISDDISAAPEVHAALGSNCHQQIVLFIRISINGLCEEGCVCECGVGVRWSGKRLRGTVGKRGVRQIAELLCEFAAKGVVLLRPQNCQGRYQERSGHMTSHLHRVIPVPIQQETAPTKFTGLSGCVGGADC